MAYMQPGNPKLFKLDKELVTTSYSNKTDVRKACEEILRRFEALDVYNIPNPDRQPARVIELFGTIPVNFKGRIYHIMLSLIFPPLFPNVPPLCHLVNPDAKRFTALQKYDSRKVLFPNGRYYYPLSFSEIQGWMSHRSVTLKHVKIRIINQLIQEFGLEYPLYEGTTQPVIKPPTIQPNPFIGSQMTGAQNSNTMLVSGIGTGTNWFQQQQQQQQPQMGFNNNNQRDQMLASIRKRYSEEALQIARKLEKDLNLQRNNMVELQNLYIKLQEEEEKLQKFEEAAPVIISDLEEKIKGLDKLISTHEGTVLNVETLKTTIEEEDVGSKMLMDLVSTTKAIEDLNLLIEDLFNAGRLDLETYLKIYKDNTEREFWNNVIMKKILMEQQQQQIH